jgi:hypothetical protein
VVGVIGYRVFKAEGSAPAEVTALLPKGARVIATAIAEDRIAVSVDVQKTVNGPVTRRVDQQDSCGRRYRHSAPRESPPD